MDIGLEICMDHEKGALQSRQQPVDIHIVTSSGMRLERIAGVTAREKGYAALCDGWHRENRVALKRGGFLHDMPFARYCNARVYEIEI